MSWLCLPLVIALAGNATAQLSCDISGTSTSIEQDSTDDRPSCFFKEQIDSQLDRTDDTRLLRAAGFSDDPDAVAALLEAGADPNARGENGSTALHLASIRGHSEVVAVLLEAGANPDVQGRYSGGTPLQRITFSAGPNTLDIVEQLLEAGADPDARSDPYGRTPLRNIAETNIFPSIMTVLLEAGADPNSRTSDGRTPLHAAAINENGARAIALLAQAGANPNVRDDEGNTPLHDAMIGGLFVVESLDNTRRVINEVTGPDARHDEHLRVHRLIWTVAANEDTTAAVAALIDAGANPNARDADGLTPLHLAVGLALDPSIVELLLDAGASPALPTPIGGLPYEFVPDNSPLLGTNILQRLQVSG
ncbi:MAG: ankyrin repeat domain-containing protein [Pseudomonadota bacterium]